MVSYKNARKIQVAEDNPNLGAICETCGKVAIRESMDSFWKHAESKSMFCDRDEVAERAATDTPPKESG